MFRFPPSAAFYPKALGLGLSCAAAVAAEGQVVVNEIFYDPSPKIDRAEFVELYNPGPEAADLSGWRFSEGVSYRFGDGVVLGAGAYLILAENLNGYNKRFGSIFLGGIAAHDVFAVGRLSNDGEQLELRDAAGALIDVVDYGVGFPWPLALNGSNNWPFGTGVPALRSAQLLHPGLDNDLGGSWRSGLPTPGKVNSVAADASAVPPQIRQVSHSPQQPASGEGVVILAKATDPDEVDSVTLRYQVVEPGEYIRFTDPAYAVEWSELPMLDDGTGADELAGDGVYAATLPGDLQQHRRLFRYRIAARDGTGNHVIVPYEDDTQPNFAYFVYDGVPAWTGSKRPGTAPVLSYGEETMRSLPVYHLLAVEQDVINCQYNAAFRDRRFHGTLVYEGEVYDHMGFEARGQASTYQVGKNKWDFEFSRGHDFVPRDDYGRVSDVGWKDLNVLPGTNPWWADDASTDGTVLNETLAFRFYQLAGVPASNTHFFQLRVIDQSAESSADQYEGDFWGLYIAVQDIDNHFLDERGMPDGNIYHMQGGSYDQKNQGPDSVSDMSDIRSFDSGSTGYFKRPVQPAEWWRENFNLDVYYSFNSVNLAVNNSDMRYAGSGQRNVMVYRDPVSSLWHTLPWDLDLTFENAPHLVQYGDTETWERFHYLLEHAEFEAAYQSRARELLDLLFNGEQSSALIDEYARMVWIAVDPSSKLSVTSLTKDSAQALVATAEPHGFATGDRVVIEGADTPEYNGEKEITVLSETEFSYRVSLFLTPNTGGAIVCYRAPSERPFADANQAMWDYHPRKVKKGIWYARIREIPSPDFPGYLAYLKAFLAPGGYGHEHLRERLDENDAPENPVITYAGAAGFPVDGLRFRSSEFRGGSIFAPQQFAGMQWRIGEVSDPEAPAYDPAAPAAYEITPVWLSDVISEFEAEFNVPVVALRVGHAYRARVRMRNQLGHWSHWSAPIEFTAGEPDTVRFQENLIISELFYHPAEPSAAEHEAGFEESDFEFIELYNRGTETLDLRGLRFTKGINFDFAGGAITDLAPSGTLLLVRNAEAMAFRYGAGLPVAGEFLDRQLSNAGEEIKLSYGAGYPVFQFTYSDSEPWPEEADGEGYSLEWAGGLGADPTDPNNWRAGSVRGGSPGTVGEPGETTAFGEWAELEFDAGDREDPAISGPLADPDGDGWNNALEFVLGGRPKMADGDLAPELELADGVIRCSYPLRDGIAGVDLIWEASGDLLDWGPAEEWGSGFEELEPEDLGGGMLRGGWSLRPGGEAAGTLYFRLKLRGRLP